MSADVDTCDATTRVPDWVVEPMCDAPFGHPGWHSWIGHYGTMTVRVQWSEDRDPRPILDNSTESLPQRDQPEASWRLVSTGRGS